MQRNYLALGRMALPALAMVGLFQPAALVPGAWSAGVFESRAVDARNFVVLGRPLGGGDWTLVVLEQMAQGPRCWAGRTDGMIYPSLNRFNYTGICNRYIDSNGYSLKVGQEDLGATHRLRLQEVGGELQLLASTINAPAELLVGRGRVTSRDRDAFAPLRLEPGWTLQRRVYQGRSLGHLYFSNEEPMGALQARASGAPSDQLSEISGSPPLQDVLNTVQPIRQRQLQQRRRQAPILTQPEMLEAPIRVEATAPGSRVVALQVIPFRE